MQCNAALSSLRHEEDLKMKHEKKENAPAINVGIPCKSRWIVNEKQQLMKRSCGGGSFRLFLPPFMGTTGLDPPPEDDDMDVLREEGEGL